MAREQQSRPDPLSQGKGRTDEVDQSKGFFPPGVPHPEGAEIRSPGSIGGGPYDESGRGGADISVGQSTSGTSAADTEPATGETSSAAPEGERQEARSEGRREERLEERLEEEEEEEEEEEPKGALPLHEEGKAAKQ
ncbi:MAG TPA: hypothetical protein VLS89_06380 [Candidatus Nanopelagicales bacterium]|nr:hypothetical protein [Candidatus Nanopelagicales bacterium]